MNIRILGALEVRASAAGELISLGGPTQRRIFAYLVDHANTVVAVERLVDATWSEEKAPARGEHNVRTYIHRLRQSLGPLGERLETLPAGYRLQIADDEVDAARFLALADEARRHRQLGSTADAIEHTERALSEWQGAPFDEFANEPWAVGSRNRLDATYVSVRELRAELYLETSRSADALAEIRSLVETYPLHEGPQRLLMMALSANGQRAEALRSFQDFRTQLIDEIGIEPSAELFELDSSIASGETLTPGPTFAGSYELHECIGGGASALVYRATQRSLDREVAVKVIRSSLASKPEFIRRFEGEARMIARVNDPAVVPLHDFWRDSDRAYLVMRHMQGGTLESRIAEGPLGVDEVVTLVDAIGRALDAAHEVGVVHRDIKPANVLYDTAGRPALADFGIAIDLGEDEALVNPSSHSTPLSPEQIRNEPIGPLADIHGLGVLAYVALTGSAPYDTPDPLRLRELWATGELPSVLPLGYAAEVDYVLRTATAEQPGDRYPTGAAFAASLRTALAQPASIAADRDIPNPYRGLEAFTEPDAELFFGRRQVVSELLSRLQDGQRMLGIVGPSGAGKSSVARAGLLSQIRQGAIEGSDAWFITTMTPGSDPFVSLVTALDRIAVRPTTGAARQLREGTVDLETLLPSLLPDSTMTTVLLIDQLEELYTRSGSDDAAHFLDALATALDSAAIDLRVITTLRADFYDRPLLHKSFASHLRDGAIALTPLTPRELEAAIVSPAATVSVDLEEGLVAELIAEVSTEADSLPMLQFALLELFERREGNVMTIAAHRKIGGVPGAIGAHAEALFQGSNLKKQAALREVMSRLVAVNDSGEPTSHRRPTAELAATQEMAAALGDLTQSRLISSGVEPATREPTVGLAHEALIKNWPRLGEWIEDDRATLRTLRRLRLASASWQAEGRSESDLYRGVRLDAAADVFSERPDRFSAVEAGFVQASLDLRSLEEREQAAQLDTEVRTNKRLRWLVGATSALVVAALVAGVLALNQRGEAIDARATAEIARDEAVDARSDAEGARDDALMAQSESEATAYAAETARLVATSASLAERNPRAAMLLANAAFQREQSPETVGALQVALSRAGPLVGWLGYGKDYIDVEWISADRMIGVRLDGIDLFDVDARRILDSLEGEIGRGFRTPITEKVQAATGGDVLVFVDSGTAVRVVRVGDTFEEISRIEGEIPVNSVAINSEGSVVVFSTDDNVVRWVDVAGRLISEIDVSDESDIEEQSLRRVGPTFLDNLLREIPVRTLLHAEQDQLVVATGAEVRSFTWSGDELTGPSINRLQYAPGFESVSGVWAHWEDASSTVFIGADGLWSGKLADEAGELTFELLADLAGGGLPDVVDVISTTPNTIRVILASGSIVDIDRMTLDTSVVLELGLDRTTRAVASPAEGVHVAVASSNGISLVSLDGAGPISTSLPRSPLAGTLTIARDGAYAAAGGTAGSLAPVSLYQRTVDGWSEFDGDFGEQPYAGIGPDRDVDIFYVGTPDEEQVFYRLDDDGLTEVFRGSTNANSAAAFHAGTGVSVLAGYVVGVYQYPSMERIASLRRPGDGEASNTGAAFNAEGSRFILSNELGVSDLWDTSSWTLIQDSVISREDIATAQWSDDGALLATSSSNGKVSIRDGETYEVIREMVGAVGSTDWANGTPMFSKDQSTLLTAFDNTGRLWDIGTGQQIGQPFETAPGTLVGANRGENLQLITGTETTALVWNLDMDAWPDIACKSAAANLSQDEWRQWGPRDTDRYAICPDFPLQ